jgi:hypothetical protein
LDCVITEVNAYRERVFQWSRVAAGT